ncbi:tyrosine-type recombinase/integrase [Bradyrhizobium australafricanum]|uniref:tyrosine-type recombinase/integrase n=1 Tax=Bradyrhizobium australafricanum TaxID=2821406 RepID=UPI001CE2EE59|nr:site-specific integrase [Bradyrhizobium australafricanum]MCA6102773.1 site-specific integrase [Bradyrhizobium australafricanum]
MKGHIRERSPGHWAIVLSLGTGKSRKLKWHSYKGTKRQAQAECARLVAGLKEGSYVEPSKLTLADHLKARLEQWETSKKIGAKTAERYAELINNQIVPYIGGVTLQKLTAIEIENWHNRLASAGRKDGKGGLSNRTIGHAHRVLSKALKDASKFDLVMRNVATTQQPPTPDDEEVVIVEQDRIKELLGKLSGRSMYPKAITALFTGARRSELLAMRWRYLNLERKTWEICESLEETRKHGIRVKKPKTKAGRRHVSLPEIVVDALREHRRAQLELRMKLGLGKLSDDDFVFADIDGNPRGPRAFSSEWADCAASIGMPDVVFHALRHTHASQLIDAGVDIVTISKRLGHANPNITLKVYAHLFRNKDEKAADAINTALANLGEA